MIKSYFEDQTIKVINQQGLDNFIDDFVKTKKNNRWWKLFIKYYDNNARHVSFSGFDQTIMHGDWSRRLCQFLRQVAPYIEGEADFSCENNTSFTIKFKNKRVSVDYTHNVERTMTPQIIDMIAEGEL